MRRIFAQTRKELIQITRDKLALALALFLPMMLLLLLGNAISLSVTDLPLAIQDFDSSVESRALIAAYRNSITFHVVALPTDKRPIDAFLGSTARGVLIIPEHFGRDVTRGRNTNVQLLVDATDANTAKLMKGFASEIAVAFGSPDGTLTGAAPVKADIRLWFNPGHVANKFYGPGIFVLGLSMFPPLLAALAMAREGEQKTILQVYVSSISAHEFLLGKIFAFMTIAMMEWCLLLTLLFTVFGLHLVGDPTPFFVATIFYTFTVASFGTMVGAAIPSQAAAIQAVAMGGFLLVFLLSGLIFPVQNIPPALRWMSSLVWGRYYMEIVRDALLQGGGWPAMWSNVLVIALIGSFFYFRTYKKMKRMQLSI